MHSRSIFLLLFLCFAGVCIGECQKTIQPNFHDPSMITFDCILCASSKKEVAKEMIFAIYFKIESFFLYIEKTCVLL